MLLLPRARSNKLTDTRPYTCPSSVSLLLLLLSDGSAGVALLAAAPAPVAAAGLSVLLPLLAGGMGNSGCSGTADRSCTCSSTGLLLHCCSSCCGPPRSQPRKTIGVVNVAFRTFGLLKVLLMGLLLLLLASVLGAGRGAQLLIVAAACWVLTWTSEGLFWAYGGFAGRCVQRAGRQGGGHEGVAGSSLK